MLVHSRLAGLSLLKAEHNVVWVNIALFSWVGKMKYTQQAYWSVSGRQAFIMFLYTVQVVFC